MLRAAVTVCVLSLVMTLPNASSSLTTGWVAKATPAVAVADGCWVMTNWLAAAGLTTTLLEVAVPRRRRWCVKPMFIVSAVLYDRPLNVATPFDQRDRQVAPLQAGACPVLRAAVTVCVLSLVMTLPNASSSLTTGCVAKATPAVAVVDGCWVMTNWLAAAGLTTTLLEVAVKQPALVVKAMFIVSAVLYDRPLKVATPSTSVTVRSLPWRLDGAGAPGRRHRVRAVAGDDVAEGPLP